MASRKAFLLATWVAALTFAAPAQAESYRRSATGTVSSVTLAENNVFTPLTGGAISVGDQFSFTATFDPDQAAKSPYTTDPSVAIYNLIGARIDISAGSYTNSFTPRFDFDATLQTWNDFSGNSLPSTDAQSFSFFNYDYVGSYPYGLSGGDHYSEGVYLDAFDFTGKARDTTSISELIPTSAPFTTSMSYGFLSADSTGKVGQDALVQVGNVQFTLVPLAAAAPEPATWAMMIVGFGAVGVSMRRRQATTRVVYA